MGNIFEQMGEGGYGTFERLSVRGANLLVGDDYKKFIKGDLIER